MEAEWLTWFWTCLLLENNGFLFLTREQHPKKAYKWDLKGFSDSGIPAGFGERVYMSLKTEWLSPGRHMGLLSNVKIVQWQFDLNTALWWRIRMWSSSQLCSFCLHLSESYKACGQTVFLGLSLSWQNPTGIQVRGNLT